MKKTIAFIVGGFLLVGFDAKAQMDACVAQAKTFYNEAVEYVKHLKTTLVDKPLGSAKEVVNVANQRNQAFADQVNAYDAPQQKPQ